MANNKIKIGLKNENLKINEEIKSNEEISNIETIIENEFIENEIIENEIIENEFIENETIENETIENESIENEAVANETIENEIIENEAVVKNSEDLKTVRNEGSSFSVLCECNKENGTTKKDINLTTSSVIVLGNGKSAEAAIKLLESEEKSILQCDKDFKFKTLKYLQIEKAIVSPGIALSEKLIKKIVKNKIKLCSEVNLGLENSKGHFFAITGSNGKTTTTMLIKHILGSKNRPSFALGNCGTALSLEAKNLTDNSYIALELSSFMLELPLEKKIETAVVLNLSPDHLNRYKNCNQYYKTKLKIYDSVMDNGNLIFNYDNKILFKESKNKKYCGKNIWYFSLNKKVRGVYQKDNDLVFNDGTMETTLITIKQEYCKFGISNIAVAALICRLAGVSAEDIDTKIASFKGVEHRLSTVAKKGNIVFINDSKATNCESTIFALNNMDCEKLVLLLGGRSKGENYNNLFKVIKEKGVKNIICFGEIKSELLKVAKKYKLTNVFSEEKMTDAVMNAKAIADSGDTVLLSPAAASFDEFECFEQRGEVFCELVKQLKVSKEK